MTYYKKINRKVGVPHYAIYIYLNFPKTVFPEKTLKYPLTFLNKVPIYLPQIEAVAARRPLFKF